MYRRHILWFLAILFLLTRPLAADYLYKGDFNEDGTLCEQDVIRFLTISRDSSEDGRLDFNGDGSRNICDALCLMMYVRSNPGLEPVNQAREIIFLHHSTGGNIWSGGVAQWFEQYNADNGTEYNISRRYFPSGDPYPWNNYPYDYWNIWVNHAGDETYMDEPTLEILTPQYDVIIFKHCYPVSGIMEDTGNADVSSETKSIENYKLQYAEIKAKLLEYPQIKFIVWTGAALVDGSTDQATAERAKTFFDWVREEWDEAGDNIFIWDFYQLETEGGLYLKTEYAASSSDSHPNASFSSAVAPLFCRRIADVVEGMGDQRPITGAEE